MAVPINAPQIPLIAINAESDELPPNPPTLIRTDRIAQMIFRNE